MTDLINETGEDIHIPAGGKIEVKRILVWEDEDEEIKRFYIDRVSEGAVTSKDVKEDKPPVDHREEYSETVEACPECNESHIYKRQTKKPPYRCQKCGEEFEKPKIRPRRKRGGSSPEQ